MREDKIYFTPCFPLSPINAWFLRIRLIRTGIEEYKDGPKVLS